MSALAALLTSGKYDQEKAANTLIARSHLAARSNLGATPQAPEVSIGQVLEPCRKS